MDHSHRSPLVSRARSSCARRLGLLTALALGVTLAAPAPAEAITASACPANANVIHGTDGDDVLFGTSADDCI
ncbi:MAG: hypothetical protein KC468_05910, partial [Myxococcales bacterium]|nr:hypothetical protein [Myxococcales bacterium]